MMANCKAPNFKVNDTVRITSLRIYLIKVVLKIDQEKYLLSILLCKLIRGLIQLKIEMGKK